MEPCRSYIGLVNFLLLFLTSLHVFVAAESHTATDSPVYFRHQRHALLNPPAIAAYHVHKSANATTAAGQLETAQQLVASAISQQEAYNKFRTANPRRNKYNTRPPATEELLQGSNPDEPTAPALTALLLKAAALVAEHDAANQLASGTLHNTYEQFTKNLPNPLEVLNEQDSSALEARQSSSSSSNSSYWVAAMSGNGFSPMSYNNSYPVYRDVTNPMFAGGAKGDGVTDDTAAINAAIAYGGNCGSNCLSSSVKGTLVYFPPGTYLISTPINAYYYSQLIGDANDPPIIKTSPSFFGLGAIQSDVYYPGASGAEWYINQSNFFRQIRNLVIDIRGSSMYKLSGLHWQVAQATSVINVSIAASNATNTTQMGFFTENGSGGFMSDVTIVGGAYGILGGNQQYTVRNFQILGQTTACICLIWDWGWTWSGLYLANAPVGISLLNPQNPSNAGITTGSTYVLDSTMFDVSTGIQAEFNRTILDSSIITLDNVNFLGVQNLVTCANNTVYSGVSGNLIDFAVIGNIENGGTSFGESGLAIGARPTGLTVSKEYAENLYFTKSRPQYQTLSPGNIISVKSYGAKGDGKTDDTAAIQKALQAATISNLIYFPAGSYIVTSTILVSPETRLTGEVWSQLVASGSFFANMASPQPMIRVGLPGSVGIVEISDMLFTSVGPLPGLIMMEWNIQASSQGSVGMWDSHFRLGGAYGTGMQVAQCPATTASIQKGCIAATMMLHVTSEANGYFENVWAWVADHDIDDPQNTNINVAAARGILIESEGPTWMYGTASEHSIMYQYNFYNASNILAGMIQTESPYYQSTPSTESPGPFNSSVGLFSGDPVFPDSTCNGTSLACNFAWAALMQSTQNLTVTGAGLYSWFDNYGNTCLNSQDCQQRILYDDGYNSEFNLFNLVTIGSAEMVSGPEVAVLSQPNLQASGLPYWSALAAYLDSSEPIILSCADNDTSPACQSEWLCDLTQTYPTVADLNAASGSFPNQCMNYYAIDTLRTVLNDTLNNYTDVNSGYDAVFGDYQAYMQELIPEMIQDFMAQSTPNQIQGGPGNQFFECSIKGFGAPSTQPCPYTYRQLRGASSFTMTYKLVNSTGFYNLLQESYGINSSWVTFGNQYTGSDTCVNRENCVLYNFRWDNIPVAASNINVPNPKDVVSQALPSLAVLQDTMLARQLDLYTGIWNGSSTDLIDAFSMPVFMVNQAVNAMAAAKSLAQQYEKEKKIELILEILGGVLAFIPFVDDFLPEVEALDSLMEGLTLVSDVGNVGLTIQSIVSDPSSAPMAILGLLMGGGGRDRDEIADIAAQKRALTETEIGDIGDKFKEDNDELEDTVKPKCQT